MKTKKTKQDLSAHGEARRCLLRQAAMVAAGIVTAPALVRAAQAVFLGDSGRALIDRLGSTSNAVILGESGDDFYHIHGDGLPSHATGVFPNANCPSPILAQTDNFRITKSPKIANKITPINGWLFGVAVNGVVFDPTGPFYQGLQSTGYQFEVLTRTASPYLGIDMNLAHTQPSGEYHYHGLPTLLYQKLAQLQTARKDSPTMTLVGWAADGFPIYGPLAPSRATDPSSPLIVVRSSYVLKSGPRGSGSPGGNFHDAGGIFVQDFEYRAGLGDLDECNGRYGVTPEFPNGIYHYFVTSDYPFIPRFWKGTPDPSFYHPNPGIDAVPAALMKLTFG